MIFAKLHPLLVHLPVGLLVTGVLFEVYGRLRGEASVAVAGWFNIRLGFWAALVVAGVGFLGLLEIEVKDKFRSFLTGHVVSAASTLGLFLVALVLGRFRRFRVAGFFYYVFLLIGLGAVLSAGYFGGELVHRFGVSADVGLL